MSPAAIELRVGGLARLSTCDWPGQLAATVFCQGCAWDCPYCHNPGLRAAGGVSPIAWSEVLRFLASRRGLLDAVVFSGGEPTLQPALAEAIAAVLALGFRIGLHTAGMNTAAFASLLPQVDWVGFDVKASFDAYERITGVEGSGAMALASLQCLLASGVAYEIRTTVHPALLGVEDMCALRDRLLALGVANFAVQHARMQGAAPGRLPAMQARVALPEGYGEAFPRFTIR